MKVDHVVQGLEPSLGGLATIVPRLCGALASENLDTTLHVPQTSVSHASSGYSIKRYKCLPVLTTACISPDMRRGLRFAAKFADVIHNHGLWTCPNVYPIAAIAGTKCRLVCSPRGTLSPWAWDRSRWKKSIFGMAFRQNQILERAACIHATSVLEYNDIRTRRFRSPVAIIPNGVDIPANSARQPNNLPRQILFLGRIHPVKAIDLLLAAWRQVQDLFLDWEVTIAGPGEPDYVRELIQLSASLGAQRVNFVGPVYGPQKAELFTRCALLVLPSITENFGQVVVEALSYGLPVIASKGTPWKALINNDCGWWVDAGAPALATCFKEVLSRSRDVLTAHGLRGRSWIEREYGWLRIARMFVLTYSWLVGGGPTPGWVELLR